MKILKFEQFLNEKKSFKSPIRQKVKDALDADYYNKIKWYKNDEAGYVMNGADAMNIKNILNKMRVFFNVEVKDVPGEKYSMLLFHEL